MSLTLPFTLFLGPYFVFALFFPPFAAALHAGGTMCLIWFAGLLLPKRMGELASSAATVVGACATAYGIAMLTVFALAESLERTHGMRASTRQWLMGTLLVGVPLLVSYRLAISSPKVLASALVLAYALAIGAAVFAVELYPVSLWAVGGLSAALCYADRRSFVRALHHD